MTAREILDQILANPDTAAKYANLTSIEAIQAQAKKDGFDVSTDQITEALASIKHSHSELSEMELATVAGGKKPSDIFIAG